MWRSPPGTYSGALEHVKELELEPGGSPHRLLIPPWASCTLCVIDHYKSFYIMEISHGRGQRAEGEDSKPLSSCTLTKEACITCNSYSCSDCCSSSNVVYMLNWWTLHSDAGLKEGAVCLEYLKYIEMNSREFSADLNRSVQYSGLCLNTSQLVSMLMLAFSLNHHFAL